MFSVGQHLAMLRATVGTTVAPFAIHRDKYVLCHRVCWLADDSLTLSESVRRWTVSEWTPCSRTCGSSGFRSRTVQCVQKTAGPDHFQVLEPRHCRGRRPKNIRRCRLHGCPTRWVAEQWDEVSN